MANYFVLSFMQMRWFNLKRSLKFIIIIIIIIIIIKLI